MFNLRRLFVVSLVCLVLSACAAEPQTVDCNDNILKIDLDGDGVLDCVTTEAVDAQTVLVVRSSRLGMSLVLAKYVHSDESIEILHLDTYDNKDFLGPRSGDAIRLVFPEKSSAVFYWDNERKSVLEFWESD